MFTKKQEILNRTCDFLEVRACRLNRTINISSKERCLERRNQENAFKIVQI